MGVRVRVRVRIRVEEGVRDRVGVPWNRVPESSGYVWVRVGEGRFGLEFGKRV